MSDLGNFWNPNKPFEKTVILQSPNFARVHGEDLPIPEMDASMVFPESEWKDFIKTQDQLFVKKAAESVHGGDGVASSIISGTETTTIAANNLSEDSVNLQKLYSFTKNEHASKLPIMKIKEKIVSTVNGNQIVIISGPTGCGKSTQVPQFILDQHAMERKMVNIIVTQPRKIAASGLARRVCQERGWKMGGLVGYQVGLDRENRSQDTRLLYVTTGILKRIIIAKKNLNSYTHIILDEVHEREEDMDLVMLLCKKLLFTNSRGTKLILMSATLDEHKLREYWASHIPNIGSIAAPVVRVKGERPNAMTFHLDQIQRVFKDYLQGSDEGRFSLSQPKLNERCIVLCKLIIKNLESLEEKADEDCAGAVLVFLPGLHEIKLVRDRLLEEDKIKQSCRYEWLCVPLHSSVSWEEQQSVYKPAPQHARKIILATNIAESSLTIPDIKYVIDFCLTKNLQTDQDTNYPRLVLDWASKNQLIQRAGRAGRVGGDGRVFTLIPKTLGDKLPETSVPEFLRVPLTKVVLDVKEADMGSPKQLLALAMDPPQIQSLQKTVVELKEMGALLTTVEGQGVTDDGDLTVMGEIMGKLPLDVKLGKMIVLGHIFGVLEESIIIAAGLNGKSIFTAPFDRRVQSYKNKLFWAEGTFSDCFAILLAYQTWAKRKARGEFNGREGMQREKHFCETSFLQRKSLMEMSILVEDITRSLKMMNIEPLRIKSSVGWVGEQKFLILRLVMFGAFYPNYFIKQTSGETAFIAHKSLVGRDPTTTVYLQGMNDNHSQFGAVYSGQIKKLFRDCTKDEEKINLTFDGRKIFVEFDRIQGDLDRRMVGSGVTPGGNMTGDVSHQVYVAVKLRNSDPLKLKLYNSVDIAQEKHKEWEEIVKNANDSRLSSNVVGQVPPPGMNVTSLDIDKVTHISSPSLFWVQTQESSQQGARIQDIISQVLKRCSPVLSADHVKIGDLYLAPYKDEEESDAESIFYRAKIINITAARAVEVFFIDYGNVEIIDPKNLHVISAAAIKEFPDLVTIPGLALQCCLARVKPNNLRNGKGLWDDQVVTGFRNLVFGHVGGKIMSRIFSVIKSGSIQSQFVVRLDSMTVRFPDNAAVDVKLQLIKDKLADHAVESYLSQDDHRERMRFAAYSSAMQTHLQSPYTSAAAAPVPQLMEEDRRLQQLTASLQGPFSPLEHRVQAAYRAGAQQLTSVEPESVNSVLLDQSPGQDQWLVAAQVTAAPGGERLVARQTSWLPARPGLGPLATMIFSPRVELRTDAHGDRERKATKITGFIAGLGPKTVWDKPLEQVSRSERTQAYFPDHDMEVMLDVSISNSDINLINKLRYWLNQMLQKTEDGVMSLTQTKSLDSAQKGIKRNLEDLLSRDRLTQEKIGIPSGQQFRWNMLRRQSALKSQVKEEQQANFVYKLIDGVVLAPTSATKDLLEQLVRLHALADPVDVNPLVQREVCPACPGQLVLTTPRDLHHHLHSAHHAAEETLLLGPSHASSSSTREDNQAAVAAATKRK